MLPSRSEGLPRIVLESFCRGRAGRRRRGGGVVDLVRDGENGVLVEVEDAEALADALVEILLEPAWAADLAAGASAQRVGLARDAGGVRRAGSRPRRLPRLNPCAQSGRSSS